MLGEKGSARNHFLTLVDTVVHTSAVLLAILAAALQLQGFQCGACHVIKITVAENNPVWDS